MVSTKEVVVVGGMNRLGEEHMPMISYAQNGEDVLLNRLFPADHKGSYIDIGANHPTLHSVTRHFHDRGWRGLNIEPVEQVYRLLREERSGDINLNIAISDQEGLRTLHVPAASLGIATLSIPFAEGLREHGYSYEEVWVPTMTLAEVCRRYWGGREIDFMKIDVEGHELEVIRGGDWSRWRPRVLVVEATVTPEEWEPLLLRADYARAAFDGLNRYYVRSEDRSLLGLLEAPVNVLDDYVRFEHQEAIRVLTEERDEARSRLARLEAGETGRPTSLDVARRLQGLSSRYPGMSRLLRKALRAAG